MCRIFACSEACFAFLFLLYKRIVILFWLRSNSFENNNIRNCDQFDIVCIQLFCFSTNLKKLDLRGCVSLIPFISNIHQVKQIIHFTLSSLLILLFQNDASRGQISLHTCDHLPNAPTVANPIVTETAPTPIPC